jgi:NAD(P)H-hydrate repair Nnr-like enzyme with NAD(P)H-hydrate dehydratase domain
MTIGRNIGRTAERKAAVCSIGSQTLGIYVSDADSLDIFAERANEAPSDIKAVAQSPKG